MAYNGSPTATDCCGLRTNTLSTLPRTLEVITVTLLSSKLVVPDKIVYSAIFLNLTVSTFMLAYCSSLEEIIIMLSDESLMGLTIFIVLPVVSLLPFFPKQPGSIKSAMKPKNDMNNILLFIMLFLKLNK